MQMYTYKAEKHGVTVVLAEESYTSKAIKEEFKQRKAIESNS
ncbi:hypothetical protein [Oceanobacillus timonensis]